MKKGNYILNTVLVVIASVGLMACGSNDSDRSTGSNNVAIPIQQIIQNNIGSSNSAVSTTPRSILVELRNLNSDLASAYPGGIDMELDIGTVFGTHGELDSRQAGDITFHKRLSGGQTSFSFFTSGGSSFDDVSENFWQFNSNGDLTWRGVFEGPSGALVVIVDRIYPSGDGADPLDFMGGSVWFRPWPIVADTGINSDRCVVKNGRVDCKNPSGPLVRCWDVSLGPLTVGLTFLEIHRM